MQVNKQSAFVFGAALLLTSCSGSVDIDAAEALPGSWLCDDGIVVTLNPNGNYEWRVPNYPDIELHIEDSDHTKVNDDGGYSILGKWRFEPDRLEMDMFGETDRYALKFKSASEFRMDGPDTFTCQRQ